MTVTHETEVILGVRTTVVRDTASREGSVIEDKFDYYAQDHDGNVWYFGAAVPLGHFDNVVQTEDFTPLEPDLVENKFFARNIGSALETTVEGGSTRIERVEFTRP